MTTSFPISENTTIESLTPSPAATLWHTQTTQQALDAQRVQPDQGLTQTEAEIRRAEFGPNQLVDYGVKSPWAILFDQFKDTMVLVLIAAAIISAFLSDWKDAVVILAIVILNAVIGFVQEVRAEQAMAALRQMAAPHVKVRRDGHLYELDAHDLVPGDIILLEAGSAIPADARLLETANLRVEEASLTGESEPVGKVADALPEPELPLGDRLNMLYLGTVVTYGRGSAVVVETGMRTQLGRIAEMIQQVGDEKTPLQRRMAELGRTLALAALVIVAVVFALGLLRGEDPAEMFLTAIAMAVAAVPEGLPAVVAIALALGAQRMLRRQALIRKLPAVETLGSVTIIASDKTGTLTENKMRVRVIDVAGHTLDVTDAQHVQPQQPGAAWEALPPATLLMLAGSALASDAVLETVGEREDTYRTVGDPTEGALLMAAARYGLHKPDLEASLPRAAEVPFTSERKRMTTIHALETGRAPDGWPAALNTALGELRGDQIAFTKGAVDGLLEITSHIFVEGRLQPLDSEWRARIERANNAMAQDGLRVLGVACRRLEALPAQPDEDSIERDLTFIGLVGMIDPPRPEVKAAVETCKTAGIRPLMITGDHPLTAQRIAEDLGIAGRGQALTGRDLSQMSDADLEAALDEVSVFARVSPEHKLRIVEALQRKGHIVAMTGDGVNDAPALRRADIGVAMGITGTDVSKEAADMVLLDDNFATIVNAVKEGRTIYDNVRKFIKYTMTSNAGEIYVMLFAPFLGMPLPLTALQILWINLVTDGLPGLALSVEPSEPDTMRRSPHPPGESIFARRMGRHILWVGLLMGLVSLGVGYFAWAAGNPLWSTMAFTTLTLAQMGHALAIRSDRVSLFRQGLFSNKALLGAVALTFLLQLAVIYWPPLQSVFATGALPVGDLLISLAASAVVFLGVEVEKWLLRRADARV
ncbi:MAG: cation-translocating P-type ATPase [Chloroflexi bacterium]|nr:cation-translocating P-type ATPase [Chloroflexota bacterium]